MILAAVVAAIAAALDAHARRIPNLLTLPAIILGVALGGPAAALWALAAALPALALWARAEAGGGDVKLAAALGALAGTVGVGAACAALATASGSIRVPLGPRAFAWLVLLGA